MSRKRNQGSEKPPSREDNKDKRTRSNSVGLQSPANDDEWEVALHPSHFITRPTTSTNEGNRPRTTQSPSKVAKEQQDKSWNPLEVGTMTMTPEKVDAAVETDPIPRRRHPKREEKESTEQQKLTTKVDAMVETDPLSKRKRKSSIIKFEEVVAQEKEENTREKQIANETQPVRLIIVSAPPKMVDVGTDAPKLRPKRIPPQAPVPTSPPPVSSSLPPGPSSPPAPAHLAAPPPPPVPPADSSSPIPPAVSAPPAVSSLPAASAPPVTSAPTPPTAPSAAPSAAPTTASALSARINTNPVVLTLSDNDTENDNRRSMLIFDSSTEEYDRDVYEPVTRKVTKIYKKRPDRVVLIESDDTFDERIALQYNRRSPANTLTTSGQYGPTDQPYSPDTSTAEPDLLRIQSESSTEMFTSSESISQMISQKDDHLNFSLLSGRAFIYMVIPPDGGYGWLILVLSFLAQLIVDGIIFSIGILLPFMSHEFHVSNTQIAFVASIQIGCYFTGGAFSSALINSYGFRPVALGGVIISALTILIASFSTNFWMMLIFYSFLGGPGLSMIWVSSQLIIGYYFERYRPIASGFSCSGAGAGIVLFYIMNTYLSIEVGWRYTLRVQVLMILLIFFVGMAYVEVRPTQVGIVHRPDYTSSSDEFYGNFYVHNFLREEEPRKSPTAMESYDPPTSSNRRRYWSLRISTCCGRRREDKYESPKDSRLLSRRTSERNFVVRPDPLQKDDLFYTGPVLYDEPHTKENLNGKELELVGSEKYIQQAAYALHNIHNDNEDKAPSPMKSYKDNIFHQKGDVKEKRFHSKIFESLGRLFAIHLFSSVEFRWLIASAFLYPMGFNIPFVYSKARAEIPQEYAILIGPAIGASNFVVRIICGFLAFKVRGWTTYICGAGLVFGGATVLISAFIGEDIIWFQLLYGISYGVAPAVYASLRALIYVRYLGLSNLTNAFGLTALAMGLGVFIGTSVGGVLVDQAEGYEFAFAMAGICIILSGVIKLLLPTIVKCRNRRVR